MTETVKLGKYEIIKELGRGGFGTVYQARDTVLKRMVALKVLHPELIVNPNFVQRFRHEAELAAGMEHPNIVPIYDFDQKDGRYFIAMGLMPKGSIKDLLTESGSISPDQCKELLLHIGAGLAYAHQRDIIHRDLKPGNILIDDLGVARVSDFGFAKAMSAANSLSLSTTGGLLGTPAYMAPEIWEGKEASPQSDIYSLGCIAHELLTGKPLFEGDSAAQIMTQHVIYGPKLAEGLDENWRGFLMRCLAKNPADRYPSLDAILEALQQGFFSEPETHQSDMVLETTEASKEEPNAIEDPVKREEAVGPAFEKPETAGKVVEKSRSIPVVKEKRAEVGYNGASVNLGNVRLQPSSMGQPKKKWLLPGLLGLVALVLMVILVLLVQKNNTAKWAFYTQQTQSVTPTYTRTITPTQTNTPTPTLGVMRTQIRDKDGMEMVYVPEGTFIMGSEDSDADGDEKPVRHVRLDAYWIDKYEVNNAQYAQCVADGGCTTPGLVRSYTRTSYYGNAEYDNYPVVNVDWHQAQNYCQWAGGDLPTEAQWEKAARGAEGNKYPWGDESPNSNLANYNDNNGDTTAVGSYPRGASPYGAMDMAGNVWEWVKDWYKDTYDPAQTDEPEGPGSGTNRVLRGGSWISYVRFMRSSYRYSVNPTVTDDDVGFRCVLPQPSN